MPFVPVHVVFIIKKKLCRPLSLFFKSGYQIVDVYLSFLLNDNIIIISDKRKKLLCVKLCLLGFLSTRKN